MSQSTSVSNNVDEKKGGSLHVDVVDQSDSQISVEDNPEFSKDEERKIIRRLDYRLLSILGVINMISLMDRTNLGAASIAGMTKDLHLNIGYRYSLVVLVFFITYIIAQSPSTVLCRKIGPRPFFSATTLTWGVLMIGFGFAKNWTTLLSLRLVLGLCEAGFYPGSLYLISTWYTRFELQKRYTMFYIIGIVANACAGILAFGLMQMSGLGGLSGWRWIFIIEGIITCVIGCIAYFTLLGFPDQAVHTAKRFLNEKEIRFLIKRVDDDRGDATAEPFNFKKWAASGADLKVWGFAMIVCCSTTIAYALQYFLPIILHNDMGFSIGAAQCLVAPPYGFAVFVMLGLAWVSDKYRVRGPVLIFTSVLMLIGLPVMAFARNSAVRYMGVFFVTSGSCGTTTTSWTYQANNIRGQWKRAFCSATLVGFGGIGGIAGGLVFRSKDAPHYLPGIYATITANVIIILIVAVQTVHFRRENRKADEEGKILEGSPDFRYTI